MEAVSPAAAECPMGDGASTAAFADAPTVSDDLPAVSPELRFERVFDRCGAGLYRFFAVRTSDRHLADDLMQQLWVQARRGGLELSQDRIEPWLRAIAKNLVRTHWRRIARRPAHVPVADPDLSADLAARLTRAELPAEELDRREVREQLLLAITELAADEQELIVGCYFDALPHAALAQRMGISERAVEGRLYRARQTLRDRLAHCE